MEQAWRWFHEVRGRWRHTAVGRPGQEMWIVGVESQLPILCCDGYQLPRSEQGLPGLR